MSKEIRVYMVELDNYEFDTNPIDWDDDKFMAEAEIQGNVWSLSFFAKQWNTDNLIYNSFIRII